ncbi:Cytochrome c oxidase subunit 4 [Varicellaria rhodocarpa]|nr:Cytochrome c oxidase subunit 4 [Varicellaria rhodocarpa]
MFVRRSAIALSRRAVIKLNVSRSFASSVARRESKPNDIEPAKSLKTMVPFEEVKSYEDLLPPGAEPGTVPTDLEQATGLERLEILGKMQGVDIFDMRPLDASRKGTLDNPIIVRSFGDEQYSGCTGYPADSHVTIWLTTSRDRPIERCPECGSVYKMEYVGPMDDPHAHHGHGEEHADGHHNYEEPKTFADFVRPEYR